MSALAAATLACVTALLLLAPRATATAAPPRSDGLAPTSDDRALLLRLRPVLMLLAGVGGWAMLGGALGVGGGVVAAFLAGAVLSKDEPPSAVRRREELTEDLPVAVDLLGACLEAGAAPQNALRTVADALGGAVAEELRLVQHRLDLGMDPREVWRAVGSHPQLGPLGRAVGRAHETGAPVGRAVHLLAEELRERARADVETRARSIEVKAAAPMGLCLLPAFVVLGVVPMVVGVFSAMRLFR